MRSIYRKSEFAIHRINGNKCVSIAHIISLFTTTSISISELNPTQRLGMKKYPVCSKKEFMKEYRSAINKTKI